jgi:hypothetical protein
VIRGRVVERGEPEWTEDDLALLLGLQAYEDALCKGCGHPIDEAWDPKDLIHNRDAFDSDLYWCGGCAAFDRASRRVSTREDPGNEPTDGLKILTRRDEVIGDGDG